MACKRLALWTGQLNALQINRAITTIPAVCYSEKSWIPEEKKTHTGQEWSKDDYRLARFVDRPKQINSRFAIDLIEQAPPKPGADRVVWCDGGGGPTGHPKVFINLDKPGNHICGYCGLRFYKDQHQH